MPKKLAVLVAILSLHFLSEPPAANAHGGDTSVIHACVNRLTGITRIVGPSASCLTSPPSLAENPMHWAIGGTQGPQGNPGATGATGATGAQGPAGPTNVFGLTVAVTGSGVGAVISSDDEISCGAGATDCTEVYPVGTSVTLMAIAATGSTFTGWAGDCTGTGSCTVTLGATRLVGAQFDIAGGGGGDPPAPPAANFSGTYTLNQAVAYQCALGLVDFNFTGLVFTASASQLNVTGLGTPSSLTMRGTSSGQTFAVEVVIPGGATETYRLTGTFRADNTTWDGTFQFICTGSNCDNFGIGAPCQSQSFARTGTRQQ